MKMVFTEVMGSGNKLRSAFPEDRLRLFDGPLDEDELIHEAGDAEVLSVFIRTKVTARMIDSLPDLKMISTRSAGFDHIDVKHAMDRGIAVTHVPAYGPEAVAEHTFCLLLACARHLTDANRSVKEDGSFDFAPFQGVELKGKVLGVIGTGRIGADVIRIAQGLGMKVVAFDIYKNEALARQYGFPYLSMDEVLEQSDFITLHVPLTPSTEGIIDRAALAKMKKGSILINTARGALVDEEALKDALDRDHLSAAGLDVLGDETHPENNPLLTSERTVITPHIAFFTQETFARMLDEAIDTIRSFKEGNLTNQVPSEYLRVAKVHERSRD